MKAQPMFALLIILRPGQDLAHRRTRCLLSEWMNLVSKGLDL